MTNLVEHIAEPTRLLLTWQPPDTVRVRHRWAVAEVTQDPRCGTVNFRYITEDEEFRALNQGRGRDEIRALGYAGYPAFSQTRDFHHEGVMEALMRRLPPRSRPDFRDFMMQFRVSPALDISDFALLGRTEAKAPGDGFSLVDPLRPDITRTELLLEIAGYRHYVFALESRPTVGDKVLLEAEPTNAHDSGAVRIVFLGHTIGYINRLQAPTFLHWLKHGSVRAVIERLNGRPERPRAFIFVSVEAGASQIAA